MKRIKLGQHFLVNRGVAEKITQAFLPVDGPILEIGPGKGILTQYLLKLCPNNKITAIELDETLSLQLKEKFPKNLDVLNRDILQIDLCELFHGEDQTVNVIGNVPYYFSKELMDWVIIHHKKIKKGLFMMQKEFVNKFIYPANAQSLVFALLFQVDRLFDVHPGSFSPRPAVNSTIFLFEGILSPGEKDINAMDFYAFLKQCFRNRRKTLFNNLAVSSDKHTINKIFARLHLKPGVRSEQLILEDFLSIYQDLK